MDRVRALCGDSVPSLVQFSTRSLARRRLLGVAIAVAAGATSAHAQWTVTNLHPAGVFESQALGISGSQVVGFVRLTTGTLPQHASLWGLTAGSWVDIHPAGAQTSWATGTNGTQQVGHRNVSTADRATLWSGTAASFINLHPTGAIVSQARATTGAVQGGASFLTGQYRAGIWAGTAGTWLALSPAGAIESWVYAINGAQQVGWVDFGGGEQAALWTGTVASYSNLAPAGSTISRIAATTGATQGGEATVGGFVHAGLWSGTAGSWVDLHPAAYHDSHILAMSGGLQAGYGGIDAQNHALMWSGTSASVIDLHDLLPPEFENSVATGIWTDGTTTRVCGWGSNTLASRVEALLWSIACTGASITAQPGDATVCPTGTATFTTAAGGTGPVAYQWQIESSVAPGTWANLTNGPLAGVGTIATATTPTLSVTLNGVSAAARTLHVRCHVSNGCGGATSNPASMAICPADMTCDGGVDVSDLLAFLVEFENGTVAADLDNGSENGTRDGGVDISDLLYFLVRFEAGC